MTTLIQYPPALGVRSASPFCTKVEVLLRMSNTEFDIQFWSNPRKAPKQKLPVLEMEGELLGDSTFIRRHLEQTHNFDAALCASDRAIAHAFSVLCEERLYWCIVYSRWFDNWEAVKSAYFSDIPVFVRPFVLPILKKSVRRQIEGHGIGLHSRDEIYSLGDADLEALSVQLGANTYFMGDHPSSVDATVFSFVYHILECDITSPLKEAALKYANLVAYVRRLQSKYFATE